MPKGSTKPVDGVKVLGVDGVAVDEVVPVVNEEPVLPMPESVVLDEVVVSVPVELVVVSVDSPLV